MIDQQKIVNTIRALSIDGVQGANSGHPGLPMGAAPMAYTLWSKHLKGSALEPNWADRDRFVLSAGHGSMLLYSLLHLFGYEISLDDIKNFRQWHSITPGHPEYGMTPGVDATTGPLGQGLAMAVGMAIAEQRLAAEFNSDDIKLVDHYTYALVGDGCLMEGITAEASSLAGHLKLGKLIVLYDDNKITIDGATSLAFSEDVSKRYQAYDWQVISVADGNDMAAIDQAIEQAKQEKNKPSLIKVRTTIGYGSAAHAGKSSAHGAPLGVDDVKLTKQNYKLDTDKNYYVDPSVYNAMKAITDERELQRFEWEKSLAEYENKYPAKYKKWLSWHSMIAEESQIAWDFKSEGVPIATRAVAGQFLNAIVQSIDNIVGGSADLNGSTKTYLKGLADFTAEQRRANNIFYGVREHAMAAISNGIALHGGLRPFCATFLVFSDYMKPSIRLSALMKQPVIYIFTHDSIGVGEDGPTHQPIEHLAMLRTIPNLTVWRPADYNETHHAWLSTLARKDGPTALILTRQKLAILPGVHEGAQRGGYVISGESGSAPDGLLIGTGSEVAVLLEAQKLLKLDQIDVRVVSMPSQEVFEQEPADYRESVLPEAVKNRLVMEAAVSTGWHKYTGDRGAIIAIDRFGESAPGDKVFKEMGFTAERVVSEYKRIRQS